MVVLGYLLLTLLLIFIYISRKYTNPYKLVFKLGKKGSGKTTDIVKESMKYNNLGRPVYTTEYIPNTYHIDYKDIGFVQYPEEAVLLIDEVGMLWDNRNFKNFKPEVRDYFKLQRHYKHTVILYSQSFDIDKKLRDLTDEMYVMKVYFNCLCVQKKVLKDVKVLEATAEAESRIADSLRVLPFFMPGARKFTWLPKYHKYFDSYAAPELAPKEYQKLPKKYFSSYHLKVQLHLMKEQLLQFQRADEGVIVIACRGLWYGILFVIRKYARVARKILVDKLRKLKKLNAGQ